MAYFSGVSELASGSSDAPASRSAWITSTFPSCMAIFSGVDEFTSFASSDAPASRSAFTTGTFFRMIAVFSGVRASAVSRDAPT